MNHQDFGELSRVVIGSSGHFWGWGWRRNGLAAFGAASAGVGGEVVAAVLIDIGPEPIFRVPIEYWTRPARVCLSKHGLKGFPLDNSPEQAGFTGGYIVSTYGSHSDYAIDAIQLECGGDFRAKDKLKDTAAKLTDTIDDFAKLYLPDKPLEKQP